MHSLLGAQNCSKYLPFLLMSPCLPMTSFHILLSISTCALKSPSRTIDCADVIFCKATPASFKKGWYCVSAFDAYTSKMHLNCSCSVSLRRQTLLPSEIQPVTQWAKRGLTKKPLPLHEQTWLHLHLRRKASSLHSTYQSQDTW